MCLEHKHLLIHSINIASSEPNISGWSTNYYRSMVENPEKQRTV